MIESKTEAQMAVEEIEKLTGWSMREIAKRADLNVSTICRIAAFQGPQLPYEATRKKLDALLKKVRAKFKKK